jgi:hypothetical protein
MNRRWSLRQLFPVLLCFGCRARLHFSVDWFHNNCGDCPNYLQVVQDIRFCGGGFAGWKYRSDYFLAPALFRQRSTLVALSLRNSTTNPLSLTRPTSGSHPCQFGGLQDIRNSKGRGGINAVMRPSVEQRQRFQRSKPPGQTQGGTQQVQTHPLESHF